MKILNYLLNIFERFARPADFHNDFFTGFPKMPKIMIVVFVISFARILSINPNEPFKGKLNALAIIIEDWINQKMTVNWTLFAVLNESSTS
ncbi:MAG: hypothetical protein RL477_1530 [Pseudomonadota bacterium]